MANIITGIRIVCALALIFCPIFKAWFYALYILGGISDVLDGIAARHLGKETISGARFDTAADIVFAATVIIKVMRNVKLPVWLIIWISVIAVIKCTGIIYGLAVYKRFISEHTVLNKICGILLFAVPFFIGRLLRRSAVIPFILICAVATIAAVREGHYIRTGREIG